MNTPTQAQIADADPKDGPTQAQTVRFELRYGKFGPYFHDNHRGGKNGFDLPLDHVLEKLNRLEEYTQRLAKRKSK